MGFLSWADTHGLKGSAEKEKKINNSKAAVAFGLKVPKT